MARPSGESSNTLFETLSDWEAQLKNAKIDWDKINSDDTVEPTPNLEGGPQ